MHPNLKAYIQTLRENREIAVIDEEVDPHLDLAEIQRRVVAAQVRLCFSRESKGPVSPL